MSQNNQKSSAQDILQKAASVSTEYFGIFKTKFSTAVVDTVYMAESITKNVLPGNPVTREYEVTKHIASSGPGLLWKLYAGFKKSTKQEATVFVLHKKDLDAYSKKDRELIVNSFKKGATQLARIKHPRVLSLQHQLEESKDSLAFATEPCFCSLANVFGQHDNMPFPKPEEFVDFKLLEVEIKYGLMQVAEGLAFLHRNAKLLHRNICPESIIINTNGAWKIGGFEMFVTNDNDPNSALSFPFKEWDGSVPALLNPSLEFLAPEYALGSKVDCSSDMFSYGMLFFTCYNGGKTLYNCNASYATFVNQVEDLKRLLNSNKFQLIPDEVREYLKMLIHVNCELRPDASQVMKIPFFDDIAVKTLEYLDSSFQQDNLQKSMFYKSLPQIIDKLPQRVCLQRIIPCLEQEFINPDMIPFLLPNIFLIADQSSKDEFVRHILPGLKTVFKLQKPIQILLITLRNMAMILSKTPSTDVKEHILPFVCRALEDDTTEIQELCLETLPSFTGLLDTQTIKHQLIPRIRKLCWESKQVSTKICALVCVGKILETLEKWVVLDDVLPILEKITCRDSDVLMAILGIYKVVLNHPKLGITKDLLATRILPFLIPITVDSNLNMSQFNAYMALIKEMLAQIEEEQKKKLEQIEIMEREKSIIPYAFASASSATKTPKEVYKAPETMMDKLMVGYGVTAKNDPSKMVQNNSVAIPEPLRAQPLQPKKELTLQEKQQLAQTFENSGNLISTSNNVSKSYSQQSFNNSTKNSDLLADSFMNSNLTNLSLSGQQKPMNNSNQLSLMNSPIQATNSQMPFQQQTMGSFQNSNFGNNFPASSSQQNLFNQMNMNKGFNPTNQMSLNNNSNNNSSGNMGFFGNLAIAPVPSTAMSNQIPNLKPPPMNAMNNNTKNLMTQPNKPSNSNISHNKSAFEDLNDIFG